MRAYVVPMYLQEAMETNTQELLTKGITRELLQHEVPVQPVFRPNADSNLNSAGGSTSGSGFNFGQPSSSLFGNQSSSLFGSSQAPSTASLAKNNLTLRELFQSMGSHQYFLSSNRPGINLILERKAVRLLRICLSSRPA